MLKIAFPILRKRLDFNGASQRFKIVLLESIETSDIGERLKALKLKTLVLHWGAAYAGTLDENNGLVVTARNQPFENGIVIDGWRRAGRLFWCPLKEDSQYDSGQGARWRASHHGYYGITAWKEDPLYTAWLHDYTHVWEWQPTAR